MKSVASWRSDMASPYWPEDNGDTTWLTQTHRIIVPFCSAMLTCTQFPIHTRWWEFRALEGFRVKRWLSHQYPTFLLHFCRSSTQTSNIHFNWRGHTNGNQWSNFRKPYLNLYDNHSICLSVKGLQPIEKKIDSGPVDLNGPVVRNIDEQVNRKMNESTEQF